MRKTSVYLTEDELRRLAQLSSAEGRSQAQVIRDAIAAYMPRGRDGGDFALAAGFRRVDADPRPISSYSEDELLHGFGR